MKTILVDAVDTFVIQNQGIFQEMYDLLELYPNKKIVLTNANEEQFKIFGLEKIPYEVFTMKHDPDKVNPVYFETMLNKYNLKADEVIYFEHNSDAVASAKSVGIKSFYYDSQKQDLNSLKKFLDENIN